METGKPWYRGPLGKIVFVLFLVLFASSITGFVALVANQQPTKSNTEAVAPSPTSVSIAQEEITTTTYEILDRKENAAVENISVHIPKDAEAQVIAEEVKSTCKKSCNISVYNDRQAFELQQQYDAMMNNPNTQPSDLQKWKEKNYIYVADHYVGSIEFSTGIFDDYPFRDWYYQELKEK